MTSVAVIGAGSVGSQTALALADRGAEVHVFDRFNAPNPWGAHAGESRLLRSVPYLETSPGDRAMLADSIAAWTDLEARSARPLLTRCGGLIIARSGTPSFALAAQGEGVERLDADELRSRFPQFGATDEHGLLDARGGLVDPQHAVLACLELARGAGARVHLRSRVAAVRQAAAGVELEIDGTVRRFDRAVVATGAFSRELMPRIPMVARRLLLGWFEPREACSELLRGMPSFVWSPAEGGFLYGGPSEDGRTVKIGFEAPLGEVEDAASGRAVSDADTEGMRATVRGHLPWLDERSGRYEMHIDGWSADGHGVLGSLGDSPDVVVATAWTGHGFKISPVLGAIAADLALGVAPAYDISHLDPGRF